MGPTVSRDFVNHTLAGSCDSGIGLESSLLSEFSQDAGRCVPGTLIERPEPDGEGPHSSFIKVGATLPRA